MQPHIRIWNSVSLATVAVIGNGDFSGPINGLSFSRADGGVLLAAIEDSPDKIISVWEFRGDRGQRITETRVRNRFDLCEFLTDFFLDQFSVL